MNNQDLVLVVRADITISGSSYVRCHYTFTIIGFSLTCKL